MKRFKFRLEKVLDFREAEREELLRALAEKNIRVQELKDYLVSLEEAEKNNLLSSTEVMVVDYLHLVGQFAQRLQEEIVKSRLSLVTAQEEAAEALNIYLEKLKEVKGLYALRDRRLAEYKELELKEEIKFLDELATFKGNTFVTDSI